MDRCTDPSVSGTQRHQGMGWETGLNQALPSTTRTRKQVLPGPVNRYQEDPGTEVKYRAMEPVYGQIQGPWSLYMVKYGYIQGHMEVYRAI